MSGNPQVTIKPTGRYKNHKSLIKHRVLGDSIRGRIRVRAQAGQAWEAIKIKGKWKESLMKPVVFCIPGHNGPYTWNEPVAANKSLMKTNKSLIKTTTGFLAEHVPESTGRYKNYKSL